MTDPSEIEIGTHMAVGILPSQRDAAHFVNTLPADSKADVEPEDRSRVFMFRSISETEQEAREISRRVKDVTVWDIALYINLFAIYNVDTVQQTFDAEFFLRAMWVEPGARNKPEEELFNPRLEFMNQVGELTAKNLSKRWCSWREGRDGEDVVEQRGDYTGTFRDDFKLRNFPFDTQYLTLMIASNHPQPEWDIKAKDMVRLSADTGNDGGAKRKLRVDRSLQQPEFKLKLEPIYTAQAWDPERPQKFSHLFVDVIALRRHEYYVWNVMLPVCLITILGCIVYGIPANDLSGRSSVTLSLILTLVAFKLTVADKLPQISYITYLDAYVLVNISILVLLGIQNLLAARCKFVDEDARYDFDEASLLCILFLYLLAIGIFVFAGCHLKFRAKRKKKHGWVDEDSTKCCINGPC